MAMTFTINSVDFSPYLDEKSYSVNSENIYNEWTDGNGILRRSVYRTRVTGTAKLEFWNSTDYNKIVNQLVNASNTYLPVTLFVNNLNANSTCNMYITLNPTLAKNRTGSILKYTAQLTLEER